MRDEKAGYNRFLLLVAGLGGLLYGVDVGIIAGALPYLEATSGLNAGQLSIVVAAVLLGSVISTLFQRRADWRGCTAVSGRVFIGGESRQRHRDFPVALDPGNFYRCRGRDVLQFPGRCSC